jgi:hypothetical protein
MERLEAPQRHIPEDDILQINGKFNPIINADENK